MITECAIPLVCIFIKLLLLNTSCWWYGDTSNLVLSSCSRYSFIFLLLTCTVLFHVASNPVFPSPLDPPLLAGDLFLSWSETKMKSRWPPRAFQSLLMTLMLLKVFSPQPVALRNHDSILLLLFVLWTDRWFMES